jgi:hypothetical protein
MIVPLIVLRITSALSESFQNFSESAGQMFHDSNECMSVWNAECFEHCPDFI